MIIGDYVSFFDYDLIVQIVNSLGSEQDKRNITEYEEKFKEYAKRRFSPLTVASDSREDGREMFVKLDSTYNGCEAVRLKRFCTKLSELLNLNSGILKLRSIKNGCFELIFEIPVFIVGNIFPLSVGQEIVLQEMGVLQLHCGGYSYPSKVLTVLARSFILFYNRFHNCVYLAEHFSPNK